jgi:peptidoglycan/xylan/chitin deacetylase (PgdA/CDA1 family)
VPHLHRLAGVFIICAVVGGLLAPGEYRNQRDPARPTVAARAAAERSPDAARAGAVRATGSPAPPRPEPSRTLRPSPRQLQAAAGVKANELGMVPVFMYHRVLKKPQASLDRSLKEFRKELTRLATEGYVPITAAEYVAGRIAVPAGRHPVVLTFDDAHPSHLAFDASGAPRGDTAVGVLMDVARQHRGFRPVATMYINREPFLMGPRAKDGLRWLVQRGFEIGNHTDGHANLAQLSKQKVREQVGRNQKLISDLTGRKASTFAYPFGARPRKTSWAREGSAKGADWDFDGVFLAGWMPAPSPFDEEFDAKEIPRIRSEGKIKEDDCKQYCSTAWLEWLKKHPEERYTSDGDPTTVAFPKSEDDRLPKKLTGSAMPY